MYDREAKEKIDQMSMGDLIHVMLVEFDPTQKAAENEEEYPARQSPKYFWAVDRLNELFANTGAN